MERHKFNTRIQKESESFQSFLADLRILANTCEYGTLKDELIRDKIVYGVSSRRVREELFKEWDLTPDRAIDIGIANETSDKNNTELSSNQVNDPKEEVHAVGKGGSSKKDSKPDIENCRNCGGNHAAKQKINHVQRLVRNVFSAESPIISKNFAPLHMVAGIQAFEIIDGVLSKWSIHKFPLDKMRIYLLSTRLRPNQERRVKSTAQWKLTANQLKLKLTLALNVM